MAESTYNGWKNYETWNIALWVGNEPGNQRHMERSRPYSANKARRVAEELYPEGTPDMQERGEGKPVGRDCYDVVDWRAIRDAWNSI